MCIRDSYCCMTPYDAKFTGLHILFDKENVPDTIGEWVSKQGLKQLRIAETEKYAHVTFFLNGGREEKDVYKRQRYEALSVSSCRSISLTLSRSSRLS